MKSILVLSALDEDDYAGWYQLIAKVHVWFHENDPKIVVKRRGGSRFHVNNCPDSIALSFKLQWADKMHISFRNFT